MLDDLISNQNLSRLLVIGVAIEARKEGAQIKRQDFLIGFGRLIRAVARQRVAFMDEFRKMEKQGPDEYLKRVVSRLRTQLD